ncbi:pentapeptide repeat-containing protein [Streptomyces chartreusis]|uniref:pentapeptide repeat-containing protein n=1 Tax=Streptomyces chartreusis TaxID=1969 RepID=UPI0037F75F0E
MQWVGLIAVSLPGLAALGALLFTWMQVGQASKELHVSERGQITSRFNAAVGNLGSQSLDIRLGGIYALQRIMQDSARDHPTVVSVLAAFAQRHAGSSADSLKEPLVIPTVQPGVPPADSRNDTEVPPTPEPDVRAAIATLAHRRPDRDRGTVIDLSTTDLRGLRFTERAPIKLPGVDLTEADLRLASLIGADLHEASMYKANLEYADLDRANLRGADLSDASLTGTSLDGADLRRANMGCGYTDVETGGLYYCVNLQDSWLQGADLRNAEMSDADLRNATLSGADLRGADLSRSNLSNADLTNADFRGAKLPDAKLKGAKRIGARGLPQEG